MQLLEDSEPCYRASNFVRESGVANWSWNPHNIRTKAFASDAPGANKEFTLFFPFSFS